MRIVAYCAQAYKPATNLALKGRADIICCPPISDETLRQKPELLEGYDFVVFNLHGHPFVPSWYGNYGQSALKSSTLQTLNLEGCGVFAINCHLGDPHQPMFKALKKSGVVYVVAGEGLNYGGTIKPVGADVLLRWFVYFTQRTEPEHALVKAKRLTALCAPKYSRIQVEALKDSLKFQIWNFTKEKL